LSKYRILFNQKASFFNETRGCSIDDFLRDESAFSEALDESAMSEEPHEPLFIFERNSQQRPLSAVAMPRLPRLFGVHKSDDPHKRSERGFSR
jgi:hypothetical protein